MAQPECGRAPLSVLDKRRLWAESAGHCQNPDCCAYLFAGDADADFAEMAHIIPAAPGGPRGEHEPEVGQDRRADASNIVVLCANCHTVIDKASASYPPEVLRGWKATRQDQIVAVVGTSKLKDRESLWTSLSGPLSQNSKVFEAYGPRSGDFSRERADQWTRFARVTIIPNNRRVLLTLQTNQDLLDSAEIDCVSEFSIHVQQFEERHVLGDWTGESLRFPDCMYSVLRDVR